MLQFLSGNGAITSASRVHVLLNRRRESQVRGNELLLPVLVGIHGSLGYPEITSA